MWKAVPTCFTFERQEMARALARACAKTGKRIAARIAMMAMTTSNSISVKADLRWALIHVSFPTNARRLMGNAGPGPLDRRLWPASDLPEHCEAVALGDH